MPINYYVYSEDLEDAQVDFSELPAMMRFFELTFGDYPFVEDQYGIGDIVDLDEATGVRHMAVRRPCRRLR